MPFRIHVSGKIWARFVGSPACVCVAFSRRLYHGRNEPSYSCRHQPNLRLGMHHVRVSGSGVGSRADSLLTGFSTLACIPSLLYSNPQHRESSSSAATGRWCVTTCSTVARLTPATRLRTRRDDGNSAGAFPFPSAVRLKTPSAALIHTSSLSTRTLGTKRMTSRPARAHARHMGRVSTVWDLFLSVFAAFCLCSVAVRAELVVGIGT
jgi:hypothetical protein